MLSAGAWYYCSHASILIHRLHFSNTSKVQCLSLMQWQAYNKASIYTENVTAVDTRHKGEEKDIKLHVYHVHMAVWHYYLLNLAHNWELHTVIKALRACYSYTRISRKDLTITFNAVSCLTEFKLRTQNVWHIITSQSNLGRCHCVRIKTIKVRGGDKVKQLTNTSTSTLSKQNDLLNKRYNLLCFDVSVDVLACYTRNKTESIIKNI